METGTESESLRPGLETFSQFVTQTMRSSVQACSKALHFRSLGTQGSTVKLSPTNPTEPMLLDHAVFCGLVIGGNLRDCTGT